MRDEKKGLVGGQGCFFRGITPKYDDYVNGMAQLSIILSRASEKMK
jgi:hypothetical protein